LPANEVILGTELRKERELEQARTTIIETSATTFGQGDRDNQNNVGTQARELGLICSFDQLAGRRIRAGFRRQALFVILAAAAGMLAYIAFRFEWIYGVAAIPAVLRDTVITIGLLPIFNREIAVTVIAALLTLVGYWMSDTIVVFERIRENLKLDNRTRYTELVNASIDQTTGRTVLSSGLTFLTAMSLWWAGATQFFACAGDWDYDRNLLAYIYREPNRRFVEQVA
jgi:preprotein translocase SecF subunit